MIYTCRQGTQSVSIFSFENLVTWILSDCVAFSLTWISLLDLRRSLSLDCDLLLIMSRSPRWSRDLDRGLDLECWGSRGLSRDLLRDLLCLSPSLLSDLDSSPSIPYLVSLLTESRRFILVPPSVTVCCIVEDGTDILPSWSPPSSGLVIIPYLDLCGGYVLKEPVKSSWSFLSGLGVLHPSSSSFLRVAPSPPLHCDCPASFCHWERLLFSAGGIPTMPPPCGYCIPLASVKTKGQIWIQDQKIKVKQKMSCNNME